MMFCALLSLVHLNIVFFLVLFTAEFNQLAGTIPTELGLLADLVELYLSKYSAMRCVLCVTCGCYCDKISMTVAALLSLQITIS